MKRISSVKTSIIRRGAGVVAAAVLAALLSGCVVYGGGGYGHPWHGYYR